MQNHRIKSLNTITIYINTHTHNMSLLSIVNSVMCEYAAVVQLRNESI